MHVVAPNCGTDIAALEGNAYQAAKKSGVKRIVKLSARGIDTPLLANSPLAVMHLQSEARLRELGIPWTLTQNVFSSTVPVVSARLSNAIAVASGRVHDCVLLDNGTTQCWGSVLASVTGATAFGRR